jgi:hypothetical protein
VRLIFRLAREGDGMAIALKRKRPGGSQFLPAAIPGAMKKLST